MHCHEAYALIEREYADALRCLRQVASIGQCYTGRTIVNGHVCPHCGSADPKNHCPKGFLGIMVVDFSDYDERG